MSISYRATHSICLLCLGLAVTPPVLAAKNAPKKDVSQSDTVIRSAASAQPQPVPANLGVVAASVAKDGVRQCLGRIDQISQFVSSGGVSGAMIFLPPREPDRGLASVSMEVQSGNLLSYVETAYGPSVAGCDGLYESVTYWPQSCEQVAGKYTGFTRGNPLRQQIQVLDGGSAAKLFLMPAGQGCVSIKKEVLY